MKRQALGWALAGSLLVSGHLAAEPLDDLRIKLADLRSDQPIRLKVKVELEHRGAAPLRLNDSKLRGTAVVDYGPRGIQVRTQRLSGNYSWKGDKEPEIRLVEEADALALVDPAGTLGLLLEEATLVSDERGTWQGQPAQVLVIRPNQLAEVQKAGGATPDGSPSPLGAEATIWLDPSGVPLAMERSAEVRFGPTLMMTEHRSVTFQRVDGRLLVADMRETYSGTALAVLHNRDDKKMKVTVSK